MHYRNVSQCVTSAERVIVRQLPGYKPVAVLGSGSTGVVTSARDNVTGSLVAIKWVAKSLQSTSGFVEQFRRDASTLTDLESPYLAQVYEFIDGPRDAAIVTELVDGVTLRRIIDKTGALDPESALYLLKGVLLGLGAAHNRGLIHRDLKPENIIVNSVGLPKVTDLGIAAISPRDFIAGDHRYRAPEITGGLAPSRASDIYSAGAMLLECLTGHRPAAVDQRGRDSDQQIAGAENLPDRVRKILNRSLAPQPTNRFARADSMLDDLEMAALGGYGRSWEESGKAKLMQRITPLLINRVGGPNAMARSAAATARWANGFGRVRLAIAGGLVFLLGAAAVIITTGAFPAPSSGGGLVVAATHTPMVVIGPPVPIPGVGGPDKTPPAQPTGLHIAGRSRTAVTLDWNPSHDNVKVAGYVIERGGARVGTSYLPGFTIDGLTPMTTYPFTVIAFDGQGNLSRASSVILATTLNKPDKTAPTVPVALHSTGQTRTSIALAWTASRDNVGVAGYDVFRDGTRVGQVTATNFIDTHLAAGTPHVYVVSAYDTSNNASANSASVTVSTATADDKQKPTVPTGVTANATSVSSIDVSWHASTDNNGVTGYQVFRDGGKVADVAAPTTSFSDYGLNEHTTYSYSVRAVDLAGNRSAASQSASATTLSAPPPPASPSPTPEPTDTYTPPPPVPVVLTIAITRSTITPPTCTTQLSITVYTSGAMNVDLSYDIAGDTGILEVPVDGSGANTMPIGLAADGVQAGSAHVEVQGNPAIADDSNWSAHPDCPPPTETPTPTPTNTDGDSGGGGSTDAP